MNWDDVKKFINDNKKGLIVGVIAGFLIRTILVR
jgi:hypothetical protein